MNDTVTPSPWIRGARRWAPLAAAWLALCALDLWVVRRAGWLGEIDGGHRFAANFGLTAALLFGLLYLVAGSGSARPRLAAVLVAVGLGAAAIQSSHFAHFERFVAPFGLRFFWENPALSLALWLDHLPPTRVAAACSGTALALVLVLFAPGPARSLSRASAAAAVAAVAAQVAAATSWYAVPHYQVSALALAGSTIRSLYDRHVTQIRIDRPPVPQAARGDPRPNIVWVIGESLNRRQMSLYGHPRPTTPELRRLDAAGALTVFDNALSIGTRTRSSVPYMLTGLQGIDPDGAVFRSPTVFNYARAAGYHTALITAQDLRWGQLDALLLDEDVLHFRSGVDLRGDVMVNKGADDHEVLAREIVPFLRESPEPFLLVVQMDGSHYPYSTHSPAAFKRFLPELDPDSPNAYDNAVLYSDLFLGRLHAAVRARDAGAWIFFCPDHGEKMESSTARVHPEYPDDVIHTPMLVFAPTKGRGAVGANRGAPVSHADIFATVLDLMGSEPIRPIGGLSLRGPIPGQRLRVTSSYMATFHRHPTAILVFPDRSHYFIDFRTREVTVQGGRQFSYDALPPEYRRPFDAVLSGRGRSPRPVRASLEPEAPSPRGRRG